MRLQRKSLDALLTAASEQVAQRIKMGDQLDRPRPIQHFVIFPKRSDAAAWSTRAQDAGYQVHAERAGLTGTKLTVTATSALEPEQVDEFVTRMHVQITGAGGYYQGWDGPLVLG